MDDVKIKSFDPFHYQNFFHEYKIKSTKDEINQIIFLLKSNKDYEEQKTTFNNLNVLNFPILKNLKSQVIKILESHNLLLGDNWAQLYNELDKHSIHIHPYSDYSGIIYLNPEKPSPTIFYNNFFEKYYYQGAKDIMLLFPSHIPHEVESLNKNEERLIISFNSTKKNKK
jgi:hypothetical protein|tara:strand:- start:354 stop:863 length:510 start_codon:yes stop_codon:yes gene_type:complete